MLGKDVFLGTKKVLGVDWAEPQSMVQIQAGQAWGANGRVCVFSMDVLRTLGRWEMCKGSQCWPVLQDAIPIWLEDKHCMERKHPLPVVSPKSTSSSMSQPGPGDTQPWSILDAMTSASGRGSYCGNMNVFSIWESSGEGQKDLGAEPAPPFFLHPSGSKSLAKYAGNPSQSLCGLGSCVSLTHIRAHWQRGTPGSRNQPAQDLGVSAPYSLWVLLGSVGSLSLGSPPAKLRHCNISPCLITTLHIKSQCELETETNGFNLTFHFLQLYCELEQCKQCDTMVCALASSSCIPVLENLLL